MTNPFAAAIVFCDISRMLFIEFSNDNQGRIMTNPLLTDFILPPFSAIRPEHIVTAVKTTLDACRQTVEQVVAQPDPSAGIISASLWLRRMIAWPASGRRWDTLMR